MVPTEKPRSFKFLSVQKVSKKPVRVQPDVSLPLLAS